MDYAGTGNTLNVRHPRVLQLVMDSLRYFVTECHVDGFRFDLASTLARGLHEVDKLGAFFDIIHQDPVLQQVKLIAEPWDVGEGGYQVGNLLATLLLSQGVPMICGGDESGRTQKGNNNAYCQDNDISWFNWQRTPEEEALTRFTAGLTHLRHTHPIFRRPKFFQGRQHRGTDIKDIMWLNPLGEEMNDDEWGTSFVKTLGVLLNGTMLDFHDWKGASVTDRTFLLLFNASPGPVNFTLPNHAANSWSLLIDTSDEEGFLPAPSEHPALSILPLPARSFMVLRRTE